MIPSNRDPILAASYWIPPICLCVVIFLVSSRSVPAAVPRFLFSDKIMHAGGYAVLSVFFLRAFLHGGPALRIGAAVAAAVIVTSLFGVSDEVHQIFVPSRTASVGDVTADAVGAVLGALAARAAWKGRGEKASNKSP